MTLTEALQHEWLLPPGSRSSNGFYDQDDRFTRDSTAGLIDTPRTDRFESSMQSTDDFSQPMRGLNLQTPGRLAQNRRNFFSLDSSQGQLAGQSSVFGDVDGGAPFVPRNMGDSDQNMDCEEDQGPGPAADPLGLEARSAGHQLENNIEPQRQPVTGVLASVPETQARSQPANGVANYQGASQFPNSIPDTQGKTAGPVDRPAAAPAARPPSVQKDIEVEVEMPGPEVDPIEDEDADADEAEDQDRKRRESSSPLSSLPPSQDPASLLSDPSSNGSKAKRKQANGSTIETTLQEDPEAPVPAASTGGRALRSRQSTKQKAEEIDSPRPKKRAATMGSRSQVAAPSAVVEDLKAGGTAAGTARTRSSARLRKK